MTTITRERAQEIFLGNGPEPTASEQRELARIALASMGAEPAGYHVIKECGRVGCSVATLEETEKTRDFWNKKWTIRPYFYSAAPAPVVPDERAAFNAWNNEDNLPIAGVGAKNAAWLAWQARASLCGNSALNVPPERPADSSNGDDVEAWFDEGWNACRAAMLNGGKS
ncbi:TPA: protein Eaa [Salmonella enterica subsp. enterica serovar Wangata]|nr:protein Eaa [Salmonella enterica subsp. enterica serovar Wangata]